MRGAGADVDYLPVRIDVENVSRCNFHCTMCQVSDWPHQQRAADMSVDDFKTLLDEQYGVVEIKLQGMGEPTSRARFFRNDPSGAQTPHLGPHGYECLAFAPEG